VINGETILFIGSFELNDTTSQVTKYYPGSAMRKYTIPQSMNVEYVLSDHLGSATVMTNSNGSKVSEMRYNPWGEVRYHWVDEDLSTTPAYTLPKHTFTGQYSYMDDPSTQGVDGFGLMFYNARFYDPQVGRFSQADSVVPGGVQGLDRYAYVGNNPVNAIDPSGHSGINASGSHARNEDWQKKSALSYSGCNFRKNYDCPTPDWAWRSWIRNLIKLALAHPKDPSYGNEALNAIADYFGIELPDGVHWEYEEQLLDANGNDDYGINAIEGDPVINIGKDTYGNDIYITSDDSAVYISGKLFKTCQMDFACYAYIMVHEATHAWIEYKVEKLGGQTARYLNPIEELLAWEMADQLIGDPNGYFTKPKSGGLEYCTSEFAAEECDNPLNSLTTHYQFLLTQSFGNKAPKIDFSDLPTLIIP
jgi:RHS repeat-associated protein